jgi:hypothetical protein
MPPTSPHRIFRCVIEVEGVPRALAEVWRQRARSLWESELAPRLDRELDAQFRSDEYVRLDRLEVQVSVREQAGAADIGREFHAALKEGLRDTSLSRREASRRPTTADASQSRDWLEPWLITGLVPWWGGKPTVSEVAEKLLAKLTTPSGPDWLRAILERYPVVARRLALQFDANWHKAALPKVWSAPTVSSAGTLIPELADASATQAPRPSASSQLWEACWRVWSRSGPLSSELHATMSGAAGSRDAASLRRFQSALLREAGLGQVPKTESPYGRPDGLSAESDAAAKHAVPTPPTETIGTDQSKPGPAGIESRDVATASRSTPPRDASASTQTLDHDAAEPSELDAALTPGLPVVNAGLVLVAPYLPPFFEAVAIRLRSGSGSENATTLAPLLLHWLATGSAEAGEHELALAKLLCGVPLDAPAPCRHTFPSGTLAEADGLLAAVIEHWPALKNTSPQGLRESFLQRGGLLRDTGPQWMLRVEHRAWDVLLERVPWTFGTIRLPWMQRPLMVEWPAYA